MSAIDQYCTHCGERIGAISKLGKWTENSAPLIKDEHGMHAVCPACKRRVQMERYPTGLWMPVRGKS